MGKISAYIGSQFGRPRGLIGMAVCFIMNRINAQMYRAAAGATGSARRILDIGCGNGRLIELLSRRGSVQIDGIDISEDMIAAAKRRNAAGVRRGEIRILAADCCALPFADGSYDAVTSVNTIYFWQDALRGLCEIRRVLKDGGVFCNAVYEKAWLDRYPYTKTGFAKRTRAEYKALARQAGFSSVTFRTIARGRSCMILCKK